MIRTYRMSAKIVQIESHSSKLEPRANNLHDLSKLKNWYQCVTINWILDLIFMV